MFGRVTIGFDILNKKIGEMDVAGLAEFSVYPHGEGLGRKALSLIEGIADPLIVVGFAKDDVVGFYEKCNWYIGSKFDGKYLVSSEPVNESNFKGEIW